MSHAPSLLFPSRMSTTSLSTLSTCTPVRPTTQPSTRPPFTLSSHGDYTCADPSNASFGPLPESTSPTQTRPSSLDRCRCDAHREPPCELFGACYHGAHAEPTVQDPGEVQSNPIPNVNDNFLLEDVLDASFPFPAGWVTNCLKKSDTVARWKSTRAFVDAQEFHVDTLYDVLGKWCEVPCRSLRALLWKPL